MQANAEALSGLVLHQVKQKGAPIVTGWALFPLDMQTSVMAYGSPEGRLSNSAFSDIYSYYDLPVWSIGGSNSFELDGQAALEHALSIMMAALDGANLVHDMGYLGQGLLGNPAAILMADEIIGYANRFLQGFELDAENLALDIIRNVGPFGSNYLTERHTFNHFKEALWEPEYLNREDLDTWKDNGGKDYRETLEDRARRIIDFHQGKRPNEEVTKELEEIIEKAQANLVEKQFRA